MTQKEQFLENVFFQGIQDMVYIMEVTTSGDFVYHFMNQAVQKNAGLTKAIIGKTFHEVFDDAKADFLSGKYQQALQTGEIVVYEDIYPSPLGETRYGENVLTPIVDVNHRCTHIVGVVKDITERKIAEQAALKARELLVEGKLRYQSLFDYNLDAVIAIDEKGMMVAGNRSLEVITGYTYQEIVGKHFSKLVSPEDADVADRYFRIAINGILEELRLRIVGKAGKRFEMIVKFTPIIVKDETVGIYAICKDITEQIKMKHRYTESENKFEIIAENSGDLITMLDRNGKISYVSPSYLDILDFNPEEYIGKDFYHNVHPEDIKPLLKSFQESKRSGDPWVAQFRQKHQTMGWVWSELKGTPVYDYRHDFKQMVVLSRDISIRKSYEEKLKFFAYHDSLTGLPNRRYFTNELKGTLDAYEHHGSTFAVIIMDLDHFKAINDTFGHDIGDKAISEFALRVGRRIQQGDTLARLGGDEFVLLLKNRKNTEEIIHVAESIIAVAKEPWQIDGAEFATTASIGISLLARDKDNTYESLFKNADQALYEAKNAGGNQYALK